MTDYSVTTLFDLTGQVLRGPNDFEFTIADPDVSLEDQVISELTRKGMHGQIDLAYGGTTVPVNVGKISETLPQWNEFFLLYTLERLGFQFERLAHVHAQGGFAGIHIAKQGQTQKVYFTDNGKEQVRLAMRWYGHDAAKDQGFLISRSKQVGDILRAEHKGTVMDFSDRPLAETIKDDYNIRDFITCAQYIPGISQGNPAWAIAAAEARRRSGRLFFTYSSLCDSLVKKTAKDMGTGIRILGSVEKALLMDSSKGPVSITRKDLVEVWKPLGLIDYGKGRNPQYAHEWRVGYMTW